MIKETESDKEALEPDKIDEGECVSDREVILVLDSDEGMSRCHCGQAVV